MKIEMKCRIGRILRSLRKMSLFLRGCNIRVRAEGRQWMVDYPDSDLNFSYRLQQMTTIKVNPNPVIVHFTEDDLSNFPMLYMVEPGSIQLTNEEAEGMKNYLDNGGFILMDDFWGDWAWNNITYQMKLIYPDKEFVELPIEHPIFHIIYDFDERPQVPGIGVAMKGRSQGITWEFGEEGKQVRFWALYDDDGRMMMLCCQNTDLGDGWEREGENRWYFEEIFRKESFPYGSEHCHICIDTLRSVYGK